MIHPLHHHILLDLLCIPPREQRQVIKSSFVGTRALQSQKCFNFEFDPLSNDILFKRDNRTFYGQRQLQTWLKSLLLRSSVK